MSRVAWYIWRRDSAMAGVLRAGLAPVSALYGATVRARNAGYDRGLLPVHAPAIPAIGVGNLSVGGSGKTPVASWMARRLKERGGAPAIVLRGYGSDEELVHLALSPDVPVFAAVDRVGAMRKARAAGCDSAVLDDAFQHRRVRRVADVVLVSADAWSEPIRLLPAGPWREPIGSLRRATMVLVTREAASHEVAARLAARLAPLTATGTGGVAYLPVGPLVGLDGGAERPLADLRGARVLLAAGVGDPWALLGQLEEAGAHVTARVFPDHHVYDPADIAGLVGDGKNHDITVCTLKDAVKLRGAWPRGAELPWYVSQRCEFESGEAGVIGALDAVLAARSPTT